MSRVVFFIKQAEIGLYMLCAAAFLFSARSYFVSRRSLRAAEFELEREFAGRKEADSITRTLGLIEIILAIYAISNVIAPSLQKQPLSPDTVLQAAQPTFAPFRTSTPGGKGIGANVTGTPGDNSSGDDSNSIANMMASVTAQ